MTILDNTTDLQAILETVNSLPEAGSGGEEDTRFVDLIEGNLTTVEDDAVETIRQGAFAYANVTTASFPAATTIGSYAFTYCTSLNALYLAGSSLCTLANSNAFSSTPIASGTGYIYVSSSLVASYKAATNWTYYSAKISAYNFGGSSQPEEEEIPLV